MADGIDSLVGQLREGFQVDPDALGEHPRYSQYKNLAKAAELQAKRRQDALDRQKEGRYLKLMKLRNLVGDETTDEDDEELEEEAVEVNEPKEEKRLKMRNKYADQLMLSEWLVDIPDQLSEQWTMVVAPIGRRCLVVATKGLTNAYNKSGRNVMQFNSYLPGGYGRNKYSHTVLDCIFGDNTFYVIDILSWDGREYNECPFDFRMFMLDSKIQETPELGQTSKKQRYRYVAADKCPATPAAMTEKMKQTFNYKVDGLMFYHNSVIYEAGQSPLVGWLKPWMMPEILNIPVAEHYLKGHEHYANSQQFIDQYNKKHGHQSQIDKSMDVDN
ncbi:unnamed protein product [Caenorhabditis bovis]|uniref:Snurportin-1 n=1 Tax=Caenorhabditis bovis TaxID=2654633 RepID=A0A8S1EWJ6_9PELO|nr:unnamed protein product [Caenorhabditis bovis]